MFDASCLLGLTFLPWRWMQRNPEGPTVTPFAVKAWNFVLFLLPFLSVKKESGLLNANPWALGFADRSQEKVGPCPCDLSQRMGKPRRRHLPISHSVEKSASFCAGLGVLLLPVHWQKCMKAGKSELSDTCNRSRGICHKTAANIEVSTLRPAMWLLSLSISKYTECSEIHAYEIHYRIASHYDKNVLWQSFDRRIIFAIKCD